MKDCQPRQLIPRPLALAISLLLSASLNAAEGGKPGPKEAAKPPSSALKKKSPGVFELKGVELDSNKRTVSFPAVVNMNSNVVEYVIVCDDGKTHESLLRTSIEPRDIHVAMLLIGAKGAPALSLEARQRATRLKGDRVHVWVEWTAGETVHKVRAEDLVRNDQTGKPMKRNHWIYNGSWTHEKTFIAEVERSILAIFTDKDALMNCADPQSANDDIWFAGAGGIPNEGSPVRVTFKLLPPTKQAAVK